MSKKAGYLLIDASNIAYAAQAGKKLTVHDMEVQALYNFLRTMRAVSAKFALYTPIVLWDGTSWRKKYFTDYKASRTKEAKSKHEIAREQERAALKKQMPLIRKALNTLGVRQVIALNLEADDLAGILVRRYEEQGKRCLMISGDKDWAQLVSETTTWLDPIRGTRITLANYEEILGVKTPYEFIQVKALMGDSSDNIPGVGGIGEVGAKELINTYGSVNSFISQLLDGTLKKVPKKFSDFANDETKMINFGRNMNLVDLNSQGIPAPFGLKVYKEQLDKEAFREFCEAYAFQSILKSLDAFCEAFED